MSSSSPSSPWFADRIVSGLRRVRFSVERIADNEEDVETALMDIKRVDGAFDELLANLCDQCRGFAYGPGTVVAGIAAEAKAAEAEKRAKNVSIFQWLLGYLDVVE